VVVVVVVVERGSSAALSNGRMCPSSLHWSYQMAHLYEPVYAKAPFQGRCFLTIYCIILGRGDALQGWGRGQRHSGAAPDSLRLLILHTVSLPAETAAAAAAASVCPVHHAVFRAWSVITTPTGPATF